MVHFGLEPFFLKVKKRKLTQVHFKSKPKSLNRRRKSFLGEQNKLLYNVNEDDLLFFVTDEINWNYLFDVYFIKLNFHFPWKLIENISIYSFFTDDAYKSWSMKNGANVQERRFEKRTNENQGETNSVDFFQITFHKGSRAI